MGGREEGHTHTAMLLRRPQVKMLALRGLTPHEISKHTGVSIRTVERDLKAIRANLMQNVQAQEIRTQKLADAELNEIWREGWVQYHRPTREVPAANGQGQPTIREDDRLIKAKLLDFLMHVSIERNRQLLPKIQPGLAGQSTVENKEREPTVAEFIKSLPDTLRNEIREHLEKSVAHSPESP